MSALGKERKIREVKDPSALTTASKTEVQGSDNDGKMTSDSVYH